MNHLFQKEYLEWVKKVTYEPSVIYGLVDWLDERNVRNQQWKEVAALLPNIKWMSQTHRKQFHSILLVTHFKIIQVNLNGGNKVEVKITKRFAHNTNKALSKFCTLVRNDNVPPRPHS